MIDVHSHILYGVDDGVKTKEESIDILKDFVSLGFTSVILTPHYIRDSKYMSTRRDNLKKLNVLKKELKKNNIDIDLYLGNEIYIDDDIEGLLESKEINSLNNTNYLLIELPMSGYHGYYKDIFSDLIKMGYNVVLAHPERYYSFQSDFSKIEELYNMGVLLQSNIESITGGYGKRAKKVVKKLIKKRMITFLGTDTHYKRADYKVFEKAHKKVKRYASDDYYKKLVFGNANDMLLK